MENLNIIFSHYRLPNLLVWFWLTRNYLNILIQDEKAAFWRRVFKEKCSIVLQLNDTKSDYFFEGDVSPEFKIRWDQKIRKKKYFKKNSSFRHNEKHDHAFTIRQLTLVKMSNHRETKRRKITHIQVKNHFFSLKSTIFIFFLIAQTMVISWGLATERRCWGFSSIWSMSWVYFIREKRKISLGLRLRLHVWIYWDFFTVPLTSTLRPA